MNYIYLKYNTKHSVIQHRSFIVDISKLAGIVKRHE